MNRYTTRLSRDRHHVLKAWTALILWLIVIAIESTTYLSSQETSRFLYPVLHFLFGIDYASFQPWHAFLRKCGHVVGYALLSILLFRAWRETLTGLGFKRVVLKDWNSPYSPGQTASSWLVVDKLNPPKMK